MSDEKFTPGPWRVIPPPNGYDVLYGDVSLGVPSTKYSVCSGLAAGGLNELS